MASLLGWAIIVTGLAIAGAAIIVPLSLVLRRLRRGRSVPAWLQLAGIATCGVAIWFLVPTMVPLLLH